MNTERTARDELYRADDAESNSMLCLLELEQRGGLAPHGRNGNSIVPVASDESAFEAASNGSAAFQAASEIDRSISSRTSAIEFESPKLDSFISDSRHSKQAGSLRSQSDFSVAEESEMEELARSGVENQAVPNVTSIQFGDSIAHGENPALTLRLSKQISNDKTENGPYFLGPQKYLRTQCEFTPAVENFLNRYSRRYPPQIHADGGKTYTIPIYGITNRSIENSDDFEPKFFKSSMQITVPKGAHNFDQCTINRAPREKLSNEEYRNGVQQELYGSYDLRPQSGPLSFFTHGVFAGAGQSDDDVLRVAAESGVPTINVDWRSTPGNIFTKIIRYGIDFSGAINQEPSFEPYLDQTVEWLNPKRCAFIAFSRGSAFNAAYMKHRHESTSSAQKLNGALFAHPDLETEKFRVRDEQGCNPITSSAENTIVLGSPKDKALMFASHWLRGDRVGDAGKQDIDAVIKAGGRYLIDEFPKRGNNFHHFINYRSLGGMVRELLHPSRKCIAAEVLDPTPPKQETNNWGWIEPKEAARYK